MSTCGEPCDGCANRAEHHLCDACCHDEVDAIRREERELREKLEWQAACTKALMESQERLAGELKEARAEVERLKVFASRLYAAAIPGVTFATQYEDLMIENVRDGTADRERNAYQRGAEEIREAAAVRVDGEGINVGSHFGGIIRALPIPEDDR